MASGDRTSLEEEGVFSGQGKGPRGGNRDGIPQFWSHANRSTAGLGACRKREAEGGGAAPPGQAVMYLLPRAAPSGALPLLLSASVLPTEPFPSVRC